MDNKLIKEALKLMQQTGKKQPKLKNYKILEVFNVDDVEGYIATKDNWLYIAYHHTDSFRDAIQDIKARKVLSSSDTPKSPRFFIKLLFPLIK